MKVLALADDLTGALEVGAKFAALGAHAVVSTEGSGAIPELADAWDAVVIDANTRHRPAAEARERVRSLCEAARELGIRNLYKKTDSTLRGNIGAEFQALLDTYPGAPLVYVPAYPQQGRTVRDGLLYVRSAAILAAHLRRQDADATKMNGQALSGAADGDDTTQEDSIPNVLSHGCAAPVLLARNAAGLAGLLREGAAGRIIVCDGDSDSDLRATAEIVAGKPCLVAGTGAFAGLWAAPLLSSCPLAPVPRAARWLIVAGSRHPVSQEQVAEAERAGLRVTRLAPGPGPGDDSLDPLEACLVQNRWAVLAPPEQASAQPAEVAGRMGAAAARLIECGTADGLVVFGGDTAFAALAALGIRRVEPRGEVLPGIAISVARLGARELVLVTKAGGFGPPDVIARLQDFLENHT